MCFVTIFSQALNLQKICCPTTFICVERREQTGKTFRKNLQRTTHKWNAWGKESRFFGVKTTLLQLCGKTKKLVHFLSTQSNPVGSETVNRKQRDGTVIPVRSAPVVNSYNKNMGGVDLQDQMRGYYAIGNKSRKWWRYLLWFCVDVSVVNAFILERKAMNHRSRTQLDFRVELAKDLIGDFSSRARTVASGQVEGSHWPIPFEKGRCKRCLKRNRKTFCRMGCQQCNKHVCLACFPNHMDDLS